MVEKYIMLENDIPDGILHDQYLYDISLQNNELTLSFEVHYYPQNYSNTSFAQKYKDFTKCHINFKLMYEERYNVRLESGMNRKGKCKVQYLSFKEFVDVADESGLGAYLFTYVSPDISSAKIELTIDLKYKGTDYSMCTLEFETDEIEYIWE